MKISIVIPTIGREKYLYLALDSITKQTTPFDEIIVFDNSVDQNIQIALASSVTTKVRLIRSGSHLDPINSWNNAVHSCNNDYVVIMGDDDIASIKFSSEIRKALLTSDVVIARATAIDENGNKIQDLPYPKKEILKYCEFFENRLTNRCSLFVPGIAFSKKLFEFVGGFTNTEIEGCAYSDELLVFAMCFSNSKIGITREICWSFRTHEGQIAGVKSIENLLAKSANYVDKYEETISRLSQGREINLYCNQSRAAYLVRVIKYQLTLYSQIASQKDGFFEFQLNVIKEIYFSKKISYYTAIKIHFAATIKYLGYTKRGILIKKLFKNKFIFK